MVRPRLNPGAIGSPTVATLESGATQAVLRFRFVSGKLSKVKANGASPDEAIARATERALALIQKEAGGTLSSPDTTVGEVARYWLIELIETGRTKEWTAAKYERELRIHVLSAIGAMKISDVSTPTLDALIRSIRNNQSQQLAKRCRQYLVQLFQEAVRLGLISRNPVVDATKVSRATPQPEALLAEEARRFRAFLRANAPKLADPSDVILGTSLRIGEVLGLRQCDITTDDLGNTYVDVTGTLVEAASMGLFRKDEPKRSRQARRVRAASIAASVIRERLEAISVLGPEAFIFATRNGTPISPNNFRRDLRKVLAGTEFEHVTPHMLRRTVATLAADVSIEQAAELLGHSDTAITERHYIARPNLKVVDAVELLEGKLETA